jgi:hypothetical protein
VIGIGFKFPLIIFDENVNSVVSVESLIQNGLLDLANTMFGERHWHLFHDGASCCTSTQSLDALFEICNVYFLNGFRIPLILTSLNGYGGDPATIAMG